MVDTMIPSEVYASLASQLDAAAHEAVSKGDDSCHVDLDVEFPMANGDTLFANLKGSSLLTWTRFRTPRACLRRFRGFTPTGGNSVQAPPTKIWITRTSRSTPCWTWFPSPNSPYYADRTPLQPAPAHVSDFSGTHDAPVPEYERRGMARRRGHIRPSQSGQAVLPVPDSVYLQK